jgi:glycosyltransferase involved in cell wall biosynthesis
MNPANNSRAGDTPIVTFVIYAHNEEKYIRAAIGGAFSQDYSPLEIVLSDDGSSDETFQIMQGMAAEYKGPHRVMLNRNAQKLGIGSQITAAVEKSHGELILLANGDDVSIPERTRITVDTWLASGKKAQAIYTDLEEIDEDGNSRGKILPTEVACKTLEEGIRSRFSGVRAASLAVTRNVFTNFGPLADNLILEDNPLYMRAMLLGGCVHLPDPLVKYRIHSQNISQTYAYADFDSWIHRHRGNLVWHKREGVKAYLQMLRDLYQVPSERWTWEDLNKARWAAMEKLLENAISHDYYARDQTISFPERWQTFLRLSLLLLKVMLKSIFPFIQRKNDRWHYRSVERRQ